MFSLAFVFLSYEWAFSESISHKKIEKKEKLKKDNFLFHAYFDENGVAYVSAEEWAKNSGNKSYYTPKTERLLIEGNRKDQRAFFILNTPFSVFQDEFFAIDYGPIEKNGKFYISAEVFYNYLIDFISDPEQKKKISKDLERFVDLRSRKSDTSDAEIQDVSEIKFEEKTAREIKKEKKEEAKASVSIQDTQKYKSTSAACTKEKPVRRIFLDPGHGGSDFGASFAGVYEKDIVLKVAQYIAEDLRAAKFEVTFSRTSDVFLPLDIRSLLAKEWNADVFVSIHINSSTAKDAHGTETYILSADATDAEARKLALAENSIVQDMKSKGPLKDILWDMEQTAFLQLSAYLASDLQKTIVKAEHDLKNRGVRQAPFFVLSRAAMPAVLVELGYLSNSRERKFMTMKKNQEDLAKAIAQGVKIYAETCVKR